MCAVCYVESVNKHGILLEVVQVLSDLDLVITKVYISSDWGVVHGWYVVCVYIYRYYKNVLTSFSVTYRDGSKIRDEGVVNYIKEVSK